MYTLHFTLVSVIVFLRSVYFTAPMVVQSGADNSSMDTIYVPFSNQRRYEHTPVHYLFMCILQIEDAPILLQHTFFILIEFGTIHNSTRASSSYTYIFAVSTYYSCVRSMLLCWKRLYLWFVRTVNIFILIVGSTCEFSLVRPVHVFIFSPSLLITRAYGQYSYVGSGSTCDLCVQ